jgi:hypothetical protein
MDHLDKKMIALFEDIDKIGSAITTSIYSQPLIMDDLNHGFSSFNDVYWFEFYGYEHGIAGTMELRVIADIIRSVCYRHNIVFIDSSIVS